MSSGALIFLAFIAVVVVLLAADYYFRQRHDKPDPECTAERAWEHYVAKPWSERDSRAVAALRADLTPSPALVTLAVRREERRQRAVTG